MNGFRSCGDLFDGMNNSSNSVCRRISNEILITNRRLRVIINSAVCDCFPKCHNIFPIREISEINLCKSTPRLSESRHSGKNLFLFEFNSKKERKRKSCFDKYIHQAIKAIKNWLSVLL